MSRAKELARELRRRGGHIHTDRCLGSYEPCGEHHAHDMTCGGRSRICGFREDLDLLSAADLLDRIDALENVAKSAMRLEEIGVLWDTGKPMLDEALRSARGALRALQEVPRGHGG